MKNLLFFLYDIVYLIVFLCIYMPVSLLRGKLTRDIFKRFNPSPSECDVCTGMTIWLHAVSVGEVHALIPLVRAVRHQWPESQIMMSTVTPTGQACARKLVGEVINEAFYVPVDISHCVKKVIDRLKPTCFIVAETELWPNLLRHMAQAVIPVIIVNGRISDDSFAAYNRLRGLFRSIVCAVTAIGVQTDTDKERFVLLGADSDRVQVTGNMKFDMTVSCDIVAQADELYHCLGYESTPAVWVCGSTHEGEEEIILRAYTFLRPIFPELALIMVPRHPERAERVMHYAEQYGHSPSRLSDIKTGTRRAHKGSVVIGDTVGDLMALYHIAHIVFLGGTMVPVGGHNPIEPALCAKPIIAGKHFENFRDIESLFSQAAALKRVNTVDDVVAAVSLFRTDKACAQRYGQAAKKIISQQRGATERTMGIIRNVISITDGKS